MISLEQAERRHRRGRALRSMTATLRDLLEGKLSRVEVKAWTRTLWPENGGQGSPFAWPTASTVFDSIWNITERDRDGRELIRETDLRGYLRWLEIGDDFVGDRDPLIALAPGIDALAAKIDGGDPIRHWVDGLGWHFELRFVAPATGRPFVASTRAEHEHAPIAVHKRRDDPWREAVIDLFEALEIDERDTRWLHPDIDLAALPTWSLWREDDNCNRFEMDRFHSYAKAIAQQQMFEARKHRQVYWVESG
jgi:hypothetical protein